jgi:hypothetical protein
VITLMVCAAVPTVTVVFPDTPPVVAVTVIVVPVVAVPAVNVAVATPVLPVVACVIARSPAEAVKATVTPDTKLLFLSFAVAVMVALLLPSEAICATLDTTVTVVTPFVVVVPVVVVVVVVVVMPLSASELPPHADKSTLHNTAVINNTLRILVLIPLFAARQRLPLIKI